jgi:hypothetical protein
MRRVIFAAVLPALLLLALAPETSAQASEQPPNTEIYLARLLHRGDSLVISAAQNVTRRAGYDSRRSSPTPRDSCIRRSIPPGRRTSGGMRSVRGGAPESPARRRANIRPR